jgi:hypothetical protein
MDEANVHDHIAQLEARIELLSESIERCRKISVGSRIAVAVGGAWFLAVLIWILPFDATAFVAALTAVLGGVVLLGSNSTTWAQKETEIHTAEAARTQLISGIALRVVGEDTPTIH